MSTSDQSSEPHLLRGILAGAVGGLIASAVMNGFQAASSQAQEALKTPEEKAQAQEQQASAGDDTTQIVANIVTKKATGDELTPEGKKTGGPVVHYLFGTVMGALYGGLAEYAPLSALGVGPVFGSALFLGADELTLPALGLSKSPAQEPVGPQLDHWAAHLVYGATTELVRRGLRRVV